ncbi:lamin L3 isoform X2 [Xyrichtys novacula]|uniref:Lamin L3 isoform X2 n=1 Tax=Xyrichtys novacula TaxID=13765 RepID=A0AAV1EIU8_XYRNO|nr:lamin L3 isoform X2 [Xyrichtys novacula]
MASATSTPVGLSSRSSRSVGRRSAAGLSTSSTSPICASRGQEKDELRSLNDRLANYIQRVQDLESERSSMLIQLEEKNESKSKEMGTVGRLYEEELADVRKSLDDLARERARLQIDHGNLCEKYNKLQSRKQKDESDLANAFTQWKKAEAALSAKDAEYTRLRSDNNRLMDDFLDLQEQLKNAESVLDDTKKQLSSEILRRVEMENQNQTFKEQLELQRNISEQEMFEIRNRHESHLVELDSGRRKEFESKLAELMQQLRQDHESQLQQYKEEMDKTFALKIQNAQEAAMEKSNAPSSTKEELETAKLRVETLTSQLQQYQKDKLVLEGRFQDLERTLDREREIWQLKLGERDQELLNIRKQMYTQLEDYENLLDVKLALDMEISAYRKMLEMEEQRLQLSPSPSPQTAAPQTHDHSSCRIRGKKRKYEGASGSSPAYKMSGRLPEYSDVAVAEIDVEGRYIRLRNNSEKEQPLGGWMVRRVCQDSGDIFFHFPLSCSLACGETVTIWAEGSGAEADSEDLILQGHQSWGPVPDVRVILLNPNHEEIAEHRVCVQGRHKLEFDEEFDIQHCRRQDLLKEASCAVM